MCIYIYYIYCVCVYIYVYILYIILPILSANMSLSQIYRYCRICRLQWGKKLFDPLLGMGDMGLKIYHDISGIYCDNYINDDNSGNPET